jgi:hypothetical protein
VTTVTGVLAGTAIALGMQGVAEYVIRRLGRAPTIDRLGLYAVGVVLRMLGVLLVALLVGLDRERFPPIPTALGYLGMILPMLYMETRRQR